MQLSAAQAFPRRLRSTEHRSQMPPPASRTHLTPFLRGVIYGLFLAGYTYQEIADEVEKPDGQHPCQQSIASVIKEAEANGGLRWDGTQSANAGRPRSSSSALDAKILRLVYRCRGKAVVTVKFVKKHIAEARRLGDRTISRRLGDAGLAWLRRRRKTLVTEVHRLARVQWAKWVLTRTVATLSRWAYTDGTVFYLARDVTSQVSTARAALGPQVWRQADGSDALYEDCVGPSAYWKAQGLPVRIWGLLVAGGRDGTHCVVLQAALGRPSPSGSWHRDTGTGGPPSPSGSGHRGTGTGGPNAGLNTRFACHPCVTQECFSSTCFLRSRQ